jgi:protein gp37
MPLNKVKPGSNMYDWVDFTHNHLAGACPHACTYCSTQDMARRFPAMHDRYSGPPRIIEKELSVNYGSGKTIFVENCSDLFAGGIPGDMIVSVLNHLLEFPNNIYFIQTKNPGRVINFYYGLPVKCLVGTTAETNRNTVEFNRAQSPWLRMNSLHEFRIDPVRKFLTIEPIMKFDLDQFVTGILWADVGKIFIGADSKNHHLPEPTGPEIKALVEGLRKAGKKVVLKSNLKRLYQGD